MFILDADHLRVGDIILTADQTLRSKGIRVATGGSFSHTMLYVANHSYIHSDGDGVHSGNTQRRLFSKLGDAAVLRLRNPDASAVERACMYARTQVGKQYSKTEAMRSRKLRDAEQLEDSNRQFCSRLVAQAYSFAGVPLVPNQTTATQVTLPIHRFCRRSRRRFDKHTPLRSSSPSPKAPLSGRRERPTSF